MRVLEHKPPEQVAVGEDEAAMFLEGPIQGADDWQAQAVDYLTQATGSLDGALHVFNPRRTRFEDDHYQEQVYWEQDGLTEATINKNGVHSFWLPPRNINLSYPEGRVYAKTSYKEFLMVLGAKLLSGNVNIAFGMHPDFENRHLYTEDRYLATTMEKLNIKIHDSLDATLESALFLLDV